MSYRVAILTASDSVYAGTSQDSSGPAIAQLTADAGCSVTATVTLADELSTIALQLQQWCDDGIADVIFTTGGTGFALRDCTPEATLSIAHRRADGIAEALRAHSLAFTPMAMFGRGVAVIRGNTLIVNLPGSPKAVQECVTYLLPHIPHAIAILTGREGRHDG